MNRTRQIGSNTASANHRARRLAGRIAIAGAAAILAALALKPAMAQGPTAGAPSATLLQILEEAQSGKGLTDRFNLPRGPAQIGLPRFDGEPGRSANVPGPARR